jgi:hypothetical protein
MFPRRARELKMLNYIVFILLLHKTKNFLSKKAATLQVQKQLWHPELQTLLMDFCFESSKDKIRMCECALPEK